MLVRVVLQRPAPTPNLPVLLTNAPFDVEWAGNAFQATYDLLEIGDVESTYEVSTSGIEITLSGIDSTWADIIEGGGLLNAPVDVLRAEIPDDRNDNIATSAIYVHRGFSDTPVTKYDDKSGTITLSLETQAVFKDLDRIPNLMGCSMAEHQARHIVNGVPDEVFRYCAQSGFEEEQWRS